MTMQPPAIRVDDIGKLYRLESAARRPDSFRDLVTSLALAPVTRLRRLQGSDRSLDDFWALRHVSFKVAQGEVVGIVGHNGAGKSTLLKVLSRIVEPTEGTVTMRGRVASLLEVGTGFHPELSGRENIYLNGSILGMRKREIDRKFDEIVAFAEVERFLETPVKRYSSGMYVRLAFSVAAHLEPEILIVDEVLAVGDVQFQKKCLGKMSEVSSSGRTVLFVSHNMAAVRQLTERCVLMNHGGVAFDGPTDTAIDLYSEATGQGFEQDGDLSAWARPSAELARQAEFVSLSFRRTAVFDPEEPIDLYVTVRAREAISRLRLSGTVFTVEGQPVGSFFTADESVSLSAGERTVFRASLGTLRLAPGAYSFGLALGQGDSTSGHRDFDVVLSVLRFEVAAIVGTDGTIGNWPRNWGPLRFPEPAFAEVSRE